MFISLQMLGGKKAFRSVEELEQQLNLKSWWPIQS